MRDLRILLGLLTVAVAVGVVLAAGTPSQVTSLWPPYRQDLDPETEGNQPGYDTSAPNSDPSHTKSLWKVRIHVTPPKDENGVPEEVCDAHFVPPDGEKLGTGNVAEQSADGNPYWASKRHGDGSVSFYSADCDEDMPPSGFQFVFSVPAPKDAVMKDIEIILTDDGEAEVPAAGGGEIVGIKRKTVDGVRIKYPFAASMMTDPLPVAWGVQFQTGERWVNSEGDAVDAITFPADPVLKGKWIYVGGKFSAQEEPTGIALAEPLAFYVAHSAGDYDADGVNNENDSHPLDPEQS